MPGGDGTGPWRAAGAWGCRRRAFLTGAGRGYGGGFGKGLGMGFWPQGYPRQTGISKEDEVAQLKAHAAAIKDELKNIQERLKELEGG